MIRCNHCKSIVEYGNLSELAADSLEVKPMIGEADRVIECEECQCEIFFNSKTGSVVEVTDSVIKKLIKEEQRRKYRLKIRIKD